MKDNISPENFVLSSCQKVQGLLGIEHYFDFSQNHSYFLEKKNPLHVFDLFTHDMHGEAVFCPNPGGYVHFWPLHLNWEIDTLEYTGRERLSPWKKLGKNVV